MTDTKLHEEIFDLIYARKNPEVAILRLNRALEKSPENSEALALKAYALNKLANTKGMEILGHCSNLSRQSIKLEP